MDGMGVELIGFNALRIVQRCFQRVLDAIDLIANPLSLKDVFRLIGGKCLEIRIKVLQQRIGSGITIRRPNRE